MIAAEILSQLTEGTVLEGRYWTAWGKNTRGIRSHSQDDETGEASSPLLLAG
jgi:hypothetical protein